MTVSISVGAAPPIFDYGTLISEVQDQLDRDDLADKLPRFIQLAEAYLARRVRTLDSDTTYRVTTSAALVALPPKCQRIKGLFIDGSPDAPLREVSMAHVAAQSDGEPGTPVAFCRIGSDIKLVPPPAEAVLLELQYTGGFEPLTSAAPENWIITGHPDIYFYGTLWQAQMYIADPAASGSLEMFLEAIASLVQARKRDSWSAIRRIPSGVSQVGGGRC